MRLDRPAADVVDELAELGVLAGVPVSRLLPGAAEAVPLLLVAATETTGEDEMAALESALREALR